MVPPWTHPTAAFAAFVLALAPCATRAEPLLAHYEVRAAGLQVMLVDARFDLDGPRYQVSTRIRTTGVVGVFSNGDQVTSVEGAWRGVEPQPSRYRVTGMWRGAKRAVALDWPIPGHPVVGEMVPPNEAEREPVPENLRQGTMDGLSALAKLTRIVAETGRCDGSAAVYDGRRRADYAVRTEGMQTLPPEGGFGRDALRCAFESRLLAGRRGDQDAEEARKPQPATAWLGRPLPGHRPIPVRIELPSRWFGTIRVLLLGVEPAGSGQEAAQNRR